MKGNGKGKDGKDGKGEGKDGKGKDGNGKQKEPCHVGVRHAACTVPKCGFVIRYQNTSNLEQH
jgi:hypothetical protein